MQEAFFALPTHKQESIEAGPQTGGGRSPRRNFPSRVPVIGNGVLVRSEVIKLRTAM